MNIKKILLLFCTAAFLQGCSNDLSYDGETKTVFEGRLLDDSNQPLSNILVSVLLQSYGDYYTTNTPYYPTNPNDYNTSAGDSYVISYVRTDENGNYRMIFPMSTNQDNIILQINGPVDNIQGNEEYSDMIITNIQDSDIHNHKLTFEDLNILKLENKTLLTVTITNIPEYFYYQNMLAGVDGIVNNKVIYYNPTVSYYNYSPVTFTDGATAQYTFEVAKNQNVVFSYQAGVNATPHLITIPIGNDVVNTSIEFQP